MPKRNGPCCGCDKKKRLTKHHIFPRRHWQQIATERRWSNRSPIIYLCRSCHNKLEAQIPLGLQAVDFYWEVVRDFLELDSVEEVYDKAGQSSYWGKYQLENPIAPDEDLIQTGT